MAYTEGETNGIVWMCAHKLYFLMLSHIINIDDSLSLVICILYLATYIYIYTHTGTWVWEQSQTLHFLEIVYQAHIQQSGCCHK